MTEFFYSGYSRKNQNQLLLTTPSTFLQDQPDSQLLLLKKVLPTIQTQLQQRLPENLTSYTG